MATYIAVESPQGFRIRLGAEEGNFPKVACLACERLKNAAAGSMVEIYRKTRSALGRLKARFTRLESGEIERELLSAD